MTTRAKFRCHKIELNLASKVKDEFKGIDNTELERQRREEGIEYLENWEAPTVFLMAVNTATDPDTEENRAFWQASPTGEVKISISNPDAAETFEIGKYYYLDFSPAAAV